MPGFMKMFGGVFVLGGIATTHISALQAQSQVHPSVSEFEALFTNVCLGLSDLDLIEMSARFRHRLLQFG
jgi:hypothetical protein